MTPLTQLTLLVTLLALAIHAQKTHTAFLEDYTILDEREEHKPPFSSSIVTKWDNSSYPSFCYDTANAAKGDDDPRVNCAINNLEVFDVAYSDCPDKPWTICRCNDAQLSIESTVNAFGRVPPGVRSHVVHIFIIDGSRPDGTIGKSGGSNNDRFVIRGPIDDAAFAHEAFHSVDAGFSSSANFTAAYDDDSCVPDNYANASPSEDFAQLGVWLDYETNGIPISDYVEKSQVCMVSQLTTVRKYAHQWLDLKESKCFTRRSNDEIVTQSETVGVKAMDAGTTRPIKFDFEDEW